MKRLVWLIVVAALALCGPAAKAASPLVRGPYSGAPSADSVVISWVVEPPLSARLEVVPVVPGAARAAETRTLVTGAPAEDVHGQVDVLVDGLEPATAYVYRVVVQSGSEITTSPVGHFKTAPLPEQTITFAVLADTQWQWEGANRLAVMGDAIAFDSARSGGFDFVLHAGDLVETPNAYYWPHWFASFEPMLLAAPFIPVLGNHEKNSVSYYNAFSHPAGAGQNDERWWTLHWGDTVVVGLDTSVTRADRILEQQAYAREQLSGSERWKFVIFHHPVFSSDAYYGGDYSYDLIYHPIFVESGVDLVFNGHAHNYERVERDGVVYLVLGGGGAVPVELAATHVEGSVTAIEGRNFYARVAVTPSDVTVDVVSVAEATETTYALTPGELLDSFVLRTPTAVEVVEAAALPQTASQVASAAAPGGVLSGVAGAAEALLADAATAVETVIATEESSESASPAQEAPAKAVLGVAINVGVAALAAAVALVAAVVWILLRVGG
jgi:acid phosphatase type 7